MRNHIFIVFILLSFISNSQNVFYTKKGHIWFFSSTPLEDIEAHNHDIKAAFDYGNNILEIKVKMNDFVFDKALMQEHFNENYVESHKYPFATFKGKVENIKEFQLNDTSVFNAKVSGTLKIHGVDKHIVVTGNIKNMKNEIVMKAKFMVKPADYKIKIPKIVVKNIAEEIEVSIDASLTKLQN